MESNFGDVLGVAMKSLPSEVSGKFLQALSGLSASESSELCRYVIQLEVEKKFRVIHAMSSSSIGGKKVFMNNLKKKLLEKQNIPDVKGTLSLDCLYLLYYDRQGSRETVVCERREMAFFAECVFNSKGSRRYSGR